MTGYRAHDTVPVDRAWLEQLLTQELRSRSAHVQLSELWQDRRLQSCETIAESAFLVTWHILAVKVLQRVCLCSAVSTAACLSSFIVQV